VRSGFSLFGGQPIGRLLQTTAALVCLCAAPLLAGPYREGTTVLITGLVTDGGGEAVPGLRVVLEASRKSFKLKKLSRVEDEPTKVAATTDENGRFEIPWPWHDYYNRFSLMVGVPLKTARGLTVRELQRVDLSKRILQGSPVRTAIVIAEEQYLESLKRFLRGVDSDPKREIFEELGQPDRVERIQRGSGQESTWWYFEIGKAYRFRDGELEQVIHFDPVEPFDAEANS
jgi:hypothetical protein